MKRIAATALLFAFLEGCASYQAVDPAKAFDVGGGVRINPQIAWVRASAPSISGTVWTVDGVGLNDLRFLTGIRKGDPLIDVVGVSRRDLSLYDPAMLPDEVAELTVSTLTKMGYTQVRADGLAPAQFGSTKGFRFNLSATADALEIKGLALAAQRNDRLDLILYTAPSEYFFERYSPTVEKIFQTLDVAAPN
jgi:hypothetical protein